jgi:hypothetical protein
MTYQLVHVHGSYYVRHVEADLYVGRLEPLKAGSGFTVHRIVASGNDRRKIAIIKSVDEAVPALADSYEKIHRDV